MRIPRGFFKGGLAATLLVLPAAAAPARFADPISTPAIRTPAPETQPLLAIALAKDHAVAVGSRGVIIVSNPGLTSWSQSAVPVQSDLVSVHFVDALHGWACGHDGVILATTDGGRSWVKQLDGLSARRMFEQYYRQRIAGGEKGLDADLQQIQLNYDKGPSLPWMDVWFGGREKGFVVGSFGDIAATKDGGRSWQPWLEHIDNPNYLDLNAIGEVGGQLYIVGEQGAVFWLDPAQQKFVARQTGYAGSLFGLTGTADAVIVFGLRGAIFRSTDMGKSWTASTSPLSSTIMNGKTLADGRILLVNVDGEILVSRDDGRSFRPEAAPVNMPLSDIVQTGAHEVVVSGLGGIRHVPAP